MSEKAFLCKNKHKLGLIRISGDGIPQLMVYRSAVDLNAEKPAEIDVMGPLQGLMYVQCDICGDVRLWDASASSVAGLFLRMKDAQVIDFMQIILNHEKAGDQ